jgi:hypothetical protein
MWNAIKSTENEMTDQNTAADPLERIITPTSNSGLQFAGCLRRLQIPRNAE